MILRIKPAHLVLESPLAVMSFLRLDVPDQRADVCRTYRKQPVSPLPRKLLYAAGLHPSRRTTLEPRHDPRRGLRRYKPHRQMHMIGDTAYPETFTAQLPNRPGEIRMQIAGNLTSDQWETISRTKHDMHEIKAQRLRHGENYMSNPNPESAGYGFAALRGRSQQSSVTKPTSGNSASAYEERITQAPTARHIPA
jgi:hypothetical protein